MCLQVATHTAFKAFGGTVLRGWLISPRVMESLEFCHVLNGTGSAKKSRRGEATALRASGDTSEYTENRSIIHSVPVTLRTIDGNSSIHDSCDVFTS